MSITRVELIDTIGTWDDHEKYICVIILYDYKILEVDIIEKPKVSLGH